MIPKSVQRFSEKIMLKQEARVGWRFKEKSSRSSYFASIVGGCRPRDNADEGHAGIADHEPRAMEDLKDEVRIVLPADLSARDPRRASALPRHHRAGRIRGAHRDRLCLAGRAPFRAPRRLVPGQLCVPVLPGGAHQAHPARNRRHGSAAQRSGAGGGAGRHFGPAVARPARFRRRPRLHS
jgi:hypothetical protein